MGCVIDNTVIEKPLIIITGISASGKTTLSYKLQQKIKNSKIFSVDDYKQEVYEKYGFLNNNERLVLNSLAKFNFKKDIILSMRDANIIIAEYAFDTSWEDFFKSVSQTYNYKLIIINCNTKAFEKIWELRIKRDTDFSKREKCLTAEAYTKDSLYKPMNKYTEQYRLIKENEYKNNKYTSLHGDYIFNDIEILKIIGES